MAVLYFKNKSRRSFNLCELNQPACLALAQEKNNRFPFLDILGYLKNTGPMKIPNLEEWNKSQSKNLVGNSLVATCLTLPNLGFFMGITLKYPKMGICYFFLCCLVWPSNFSWFTFSFMFDLGFHCYKGKSMGRPRSVSVYCILLVNFVVYLA